jgi:hypothetical protein
MDLSVDLSVDVETGRRAFAESVTSFLRAVDGFGEWELLGASRCHGWTRLDVVVHVIAGWQEMLGGMVSVVDRAQTVDAASYWPAFAAEYRQDDPVVPLMAQRRRTAAFARPASARAELHDVAAAVQRGCAGLADASYLWQGHVFAAGDFLTIWAVEDAIHQLDLLSEEPVPDSALSLTRATIEALAGGPLPAASVEEAVLVGAGRLPVPDGLGAVGERLPALG